MPALVLVPLIMPVPVPVPVPMPVPVSGVAVLVPLIMVVPVPVPVPVPVVGGLAVLVPLIMAVPVRLIMRMLAWGIAPMRVQVVIMGAVVPSIMPILVPLIMLVFVPSTHAVDEPEDGLATGLAATALEAPKAITPAAKAPTSNGRLQAVTFCPSAPLVPISLLCPGVILNSFLICSLLRYTCRVPHGCCGRG
jgi:hypothetical protein